MAEGCLFEAHQGLVTSDAWVSEAGKPECCHLQMANGIHPRLAAHLCSAVAEDPAFEPGLYLLQTSTHTCNFLAAVDLWPTETRRRSRVWVGEGPPRNRYGRAARPVSSSGGGKMLSGIVLLSVGKTLQTQFSAPGWGREPHCCRRNRYVAGVYGLSQRPVPAHSWRQLLLLLQVLLFYRRGLVLAVCGWAACAPCLCTQC